MATAIELIKTRLQSDTTLYGSLGSTGYSGYAKGGIYTKKLKREPPGDTPTAFAASASGLVVRPSIVILDRGDRPHLQEPSIPSAYQGTVLIYFHASATQSGKDAIAAMRKRVYELIDFAMSGWTFRLEEGAPIVFPKYIDRSGVQDDEIYPEGVVDFCRYQLTSRHANIV
jgi:hypothetical protein